MVHCVFLSLLMLGTKHFILGEKRSLETGKTEDVRCLSIGVQEFKCRWGNEIGMQRFILKNPNENTNNWTNSALNYVEWITFSNKQCELIKLTNC